MTSLRLPTQIGMGRTIITILAKTIIETGMITLNIPLLRLAEEENIANLSKDYALAIAYLLITKVRDTLALQW